VFSRGADDAWSLTEKLTAADGRASDGFGYDVSMQNNTVAVGAPFHDQGEVETGAVYVYRLKFNNAPHLVSPVPDPFGPAPNYVVELLEPFELQVTFGDRDIHDELTVSAVIDPVSWLQYDAVSGVLSGIPNQTGTVTVTIMAVDRDGVAAVTGFDVTVVATTSHSLRYLWRTKFFGDDAVNDPSLEDVLWGDDADPDGDGLTNTHEYLFGTDPSRPDDRVIDIAAAPEPPCMLLAYKRRTDDPDLVYALQTCDSLMAGWRLGHALVERECVTPLDGGYELVTLWVRGAAPGSGPCFFRVRVTRPDP
jgi:hypothetical protein